MSFHYTRRVLLDRRVFKRARNVSLHLLSRCHLFSFWSIGKWTLLFNKFNRINRFNSTKINIFLIVNYRTLLFIFLVVFISSIIYIYRINYINLNNFSLKRFYYLIIFLLSIIILILSPNILGWDGLGLISYCLIIYYNKLNSFNSEIITIILNRFRWYKFINNYFFFKYVWKMKFNYL